MKAGAFFFLLFFSISLSPFALAETSFNFIGNMGGEPPELGYWDGAAMVSFLVNDSRAIMIRHSDNESIRLLNLFLRGTDLGEIKVDLVKGSSYSRYILKNATITEISPFIEPEKEWALEKVIFSYEGLERQDVSQEEAEIEPAAQDVSPETLSTANGESNEGGGIRGWLSIIKSFFMKILQKEERIPEVEVNVPNPGAEGIETKKDVQVKEESNQSLVETKDEGGGSIGQEPKEEPEKLSNANCTDTCPEEGSTKCEAYSDLYTCINGCWAHTSYCFADDLRCVTREGVSRCEEIDCYGQCGDDGAVSGCASDRQSYYLCKDGCYQYVEEECPE